MAIRKEKKEEIIKIGIEDLDKSKALIFTDFSGTSVSDINKLRADLRSIGSRLRVIKKRLLGIIFKSKEVVYEPKELVGEVGTVFVEGDLSETAGALYRFAQDKESFKLLGAYDLEQRQTISAEMINMLGSLPPRKELLGQLIGAVVGPLRTLIYILSVKSKQG